MDTIPFHWDTLDAPQCLRMTCLCPDECHEDLVCRLYQRRHRRRNKRHPAAKGQALRGARLKALLALDFCLCMRGRSCNSSILVHISGLAPVFHPGGNYSVAVRAIHLTVNMPLQISVAIPRLSGAAEMRGPARGTMPTSICGWVSAVRFARSGRISFRLIAQR